MTESEELYDKVSRALAEKHIQLVDFSVSRHRGGIAVRAVVYKKEGTGIDDCAFAHRLIQGYLTPIFGTDDFKLETMSPGLGRQITHVREYSIFIGRAVRLLLFTQEYIIGKIVSVVDGSLTINTADGDISIPMADIHKAKLDDSIGG